MKISHASSDTKKTFIPHLSCKKRTKTRKKEPKEAYMIDGNVNVFGFFACFFLAFDRISRLASSLFVSCIFSLFDQILIDCNLSSRNSFWDLFFLDSDSDQMEFRLSDSFRRVMSAFLTTYQHEILVVPHASIPRQWRILLCV